MWAIAPLLRTILLVDSSLPVVTSATLRATISLTRRKWRQGKP